MVDFFFSFIQCNYNQFYECSENIKKNIGIERVKFLSKQKLHKVDHKYYSDSLKSLCTKVFI